MTQGEEGVQGLGSERLELSRGTTAIPPNGPTGLGMRSVGLAAGVSVLLAALAMLRGLARLPGM